MMKDISIGIEIECIFNIQLFNITPGGYHSGRQVPGLKRWTAESDGSLEHEEEFGHYSKCVELISPIFKSKSSFFRGLHKFQKVLSNNSKHELFQVMKFNKSCGSHLHFSITGFPFSDKVIFEVYPKIRKHFLNLLSKSDICSKDWIASHYDRAFARLLTKQQFSYHTRNSEFNFQSEYEGKGLEWRSLNLLGIQTWREFFEFWNIVYDSLEALYFNSLKYESEASVELLGTDKYSKNEHADENKILYKSKKRKKSHSYYKISLDNEKEVYDEIKCAI